VSAGGDDGHLPDLDDLETLEGVVIPALEAHIAGHEPFSSTWVCGMTLLATIRNRLLLIRRVEAVERQLAAFEAHTSAITEDAIASVVAKVIAGVRLADRGR
jgi:hypothetical protein